MGLFGSPRLGVSGMHEQMEFMCLNCGVSLYLSAEKVSLEEGDGADTRSLRGVFCAECSGRLILIGKAGAEPYYRTE
jgi:hypothetical protein